MWFITLIPFWSRKLGPDFSLFHIFSRVPSMLFSGLLLFLLKMLHCFLFGYSFGGHVTGANPPRPQFCFGVFFVFQSFAAVAESSVLRMRARICCSRVCSRFVLVCLFGSVQI